MQVSHIILRVADLERAIGFYRDHVGLVLLGASETFAFFDGGTIRIALNHRPGQMPDTSATEVVIEVDDVTAAWRALVERGVSFAAEPREVMVDGDRALHAAHFVDPDGHVMSITGWMATADAADD